MLTVKADKLRLDAHGPVLDLGCGQGRHSFYLSKLGQKVISMDLEIGDLKYVDSLYKAMKAASEITDQDLPLLIRGNALRLPFGDGSLRCVVASEILEHIPEDALVLSEIARVLKPNAVLAISVPRFYPELISWMLSKKYHSVKGGHIRIYRKRQLFSLLAGYNFSVTSVEYAHGLHSPYWWLKCLVGVDNEKNAVVRAYKKVLEYEIIKQPPILRYMGKILDPLLGKSIVIYAQYMYK